MAAKAQILKLHRWIGLPLALLLLVQAATGMSLVFRDSLERVIHPALIVAPQPQRVPMQAMLDRVRAAHPDMKVARAELPDAPDQAVMFRLGREGEPPFLAAVNPYDGNIVREGPRSAWPLEFLFGVHEQLLSGAVGQTIVGIEGILLLLLAVTGPFVWWPARGKLRQGFKVKLRGKADPRWRTLHRSVGAGVAVLLLLSASTGVLMVWKEGLQKGLAQIVRVDHKPSPKVAKQPGRTPLPVDLLVARAQAALGPAPLRQLRFSSGGRAVAVYLDNDRTIRPDGAAQIYFDAYDGRVLGRHVPGTLPAASEFVDWLYTVHTGIWGGLVTKLLLLATGLVLAGLAASGPWLWWSRRSRRRAADRKRPAGAPAREEATA